jgi:hypothetical protein
MSKIVSGWDLIFISTGIRIYNGAPIADQISYSSTDNFLMPVKIEPDKITLEEIHSIAKDYSSRFPNFYFYEKEHIIAGWLLITGNFLLKIFHSHQPVWRLLIFLKKVEKGLGIAFMKRAVFNRSGNKKSNGFSLVRDSQ